jgi:DASH complex subunit Hsk3 like
MSTTNSKPSSRAASSASGPNPSTSSNKNRQYAHLHAQLAQLNAHLADTENLVRMTAVQAQDMRFLGGYVGAMFMGSARVLGEESVVRAESRQEGGSGGGEVEIGGKEV